MYNEEILDNIIDSFKHIVYNVYIYSHAHKHTNNRVHVYICKYA